MTKKFFSNQIYRTNGHNLTPLTKGLSKFLLLFFSALERLISVLAVAAASKPTKTDPKKAIIKAIIK